MWTLTPGELTISICILGFLILGLYRLIQRFRLPLPPGPQPKFLKAASNPEVLKFEPWKMYARWSKDYGSPIISYRVFGNYTIILNSLKAVNELLEARSSIYSDRPNLWTHDLMNRNFSVFALTSQSPRFKVYRKMLHSGLNLRAVHRYRSIQQDERVTLLKGLLTSPGKFIRHITRNASAVILKISYGWSVVDDDDYLIKAAMERRKLNAQAVQAGQWLLDVFPPLRSIPEWVPGAGFKKQVRVWAEQISQLDLYPLNWVKQRMVTGDYVDSFASQHLQPDDGHEVDAEEDDVIKWVSQALYVGGADTTISAMMTFTLLMTVHPEIQYKAQAEIDRVIGTERLPTVEDLGSLPYVAAIFKEVLRFHPVAPLGLPHCVLREDTYMGYRIPRGTTITANIWAITHEPELYPCPSKFDPGRFLGKKPQHDPRRIVFGFGRRSCPGAHLAEVTTLLNLASILAVFNILKPLNMDGEEVDPIMEFTTGTTSRPKPFACRIEPRSEQSRTLVEGYTR